MPERICRGRAASPGLGGRPLVRLAARCRPSREPGDVAIAGARSGRRCAWRRSRRAAASWRALVAATRRDEAPRSWSSSSRCSRTGRCSDAAFAAIEAGAPAARAWRDGLDARSPAMRTPRTSISAPAPAISPTCATACCAHLAGARREPALPAGADPVGDDLTPSRFLALDWQPGRRRRARARQPAQPCRDAGARPRRPDGGRPRASVPANGRAEAIARRRERPLVLVARPRRRASDVAAARGRVRERGAAGDAPSAPRRRVTVDGERDRGDGQYRRSGASSTRSTSPPATASA